MEKIRLAIVSPGKDVYSETFILQHKLLINAKVDYLYGGLLPLSSELNDEIVAYRFINKIRRRISILFGRPQPAFHERKISSYLKKNSIQLVLAEFGQTGVAMMPVCEKSGIPLLVHFHGYDASVHAIIDKYRRSYAEMFRKAAAIFSVSEHMSRKLISLGCPANKIILNHYGPSEIYSSVNRNTTSRQFIAVGRFTEKKSPESTLRAFKKVLDQEPDVNLVMVGSGHLLANCQALVKEMGIENAVHFAGVLPPEKIAGLFSSSIAFIQHSVEAANGDCEGTPVAILEAGAAGLPVVATLHAGIPDVVVHGTTGYLVKEHDIDAMADYMLKILREPALSVSMGLAARERITSLFSLEKHVARINEAIERSLIPA